MAESKIFLVNQEKKLTPMEETPYVIENDLQTFLAAYPDLLPGDQINPEAPRRWVLVAREMGVPDKEDGSGRWSADHLFLDQDGIPTFVECKLSSNPESRREVVAQMLDYAANGTKYWSIPYVLKAAAETTRRLNIPDINDRIKELLSLNEMDQDSETRIKDYWDQVEKNLKNGQVRLLFVADEIPKDLRRLVEFLNEQMKDVEVLAVEVKQYLGDSDQIVLVPRVIGVTETTSGKIEPKDKKPVLTRETFFAHCNSAEISAFFENVLDKAKGKGHSIRWGKSGFSVRVKSPKTGKLATFVLCTPGNRGLRVGFWFYFSELVKEFPRFGDDAHKLRQELLKRFPIFREEEKTLIVDIDDQTLPKLPVAYDFILEKIDEIKEKY